MSDTPILQPEVSRATLVEAVATAVAPMQPEDGDIYDEDSGEQIAAMITDDEETRAMFLVRALKIQEISILLGGEWYVFKRDRKYEDDV